MNLKTLAISVPLFAVFLVGTPASGQSTGAIAGIVTDASSGAPLSSANVVVPTLNRGAATGNDGRFTLRNIPVGEHDVQIRFVGYQSETRVVHVTAGTTTRIKVALEYKSVNLGGVQVTALRPDLQPTGELESEQIRKAEVADPGELLRDLPGIGSVRRGPMGLDPNVRGLAETEVGVYIGGMRTFPAGPARMDSPMSHVDPSTIVSIDVVKGPYALTWGPGNMSAIQVEQRGTNPPPTVLTGSVHTGFDTNRQAVETTAFAMGRQGDWFYSANGAWRSGDDFTGGNGELVPGDFESADGRARLGVELSDRSTLAVSGSYQDQRDLDYPGRLLNAEFFKTGIGQLDYEYTHDEGLFQRLEVRASAQQTLHEMTNRGKPTYEAGKNRPPLRIGVASKIQNFSGRVATDLRLDSQLGVTLGGDVLHTFRDASRSLEAAPPSRDPFVPPFYKTDSGELLDNLWPGVTITQAGTFAKLEYPIGTVASLTATGRLDFSRSDAHDPTGPFLDNAGATAEDLTQEDVMLSGAMTASVPLSDAWTLSLGAGSVARPPSALERYSDRFPTSKSQTSAEFQGTPFLNPERSTQADIWLEGAGSNWSLSVNGFARHLTNYITLESTTIDPILRLSPETVYRYVNGEANFVGSEVQAALAVADPLTVRASGSWLWGRDDAADEPAFGVAPPSADLSLRWAPSVRVRNVSGVYVEGTANLVAEQDRVPASRTETPTDGYTTVDLQTGIRLMDQMKLTLGVENLFDVSYANHLNAKNPFFGVQLPEPGRVFTTNLTVSF